jgi:hypothetical protein
MERLVISHKYKNDDQGRIAVVEASLAAGQSVLTTAMN